MYYLFILYPFHIPSVFNIIIIITDVVLQDFCTVANQTTNIFQHQRKWFRNILRGEKIGSLPSCTNVSAPLVTSATACFLAESTPTLSDTAAGPTSTTPGPTPSAPVAAPTPATAIATSGTASSTLISAFLLGLIGTFTLV
jgi:hypothetical protein